MSQDIDIGIVTKVRTYLEADEASSPADLYTALWKHRNQLHPDNFSDEAARKAAEEKFKDVQGLLESLQRYIENDALTGSPRELALYKPNLDRIYLVAEVDSLKEKLREATDEIGNLKYDLNQEKERASELERQLTNRLEDSLKAEAHEIETLYKPSLQTFAPAGVVVLVSAVLAAMSKMEEAAVMLQKYSPLDETYVRRLLFVLFVGSFGWIFKSFLEHALLKRRALEIASPQFAKQFLEYLRSLRETQTEKVNTFTESEVSVFIRGKVHWWHRPLAIFGFHTFQSQITNKLTDYFIATLLTKKLIEVAGADFLDRSFIIKTERGRYYYIP